MTAEKDGNRRPFLLLQSKSFCRYNIDNFKIKAVLPIAVEKAFLIYHNDILYISPKYMDETDMNSNFLLKIYLICALM